MSEKDIALKPAIEVENLVIRYGSVTAVEGVSFSVNMGEQLTLLGPSGCGKTTSLRAIAGLETPISGAIRIHGKAVYYSVAKLNVPADQRGLSMVFQSYAIWPHMSVFENVAYGLRVRKVAGQELKDKVFQALEKVKMGAYAERNSSALSGGQQQRVALARAIAFSPSVILFDEPLSNLDAKLRSEMRVELRELQRSLGITALYVTHDLEEALAMSDTIVVMRAGKIEQTGTATEIYNAPRTNFVADFVGSANLIAGTIIKSDAGKGTFTLQATDGLLIQGVTHGRALSTEAQCAIRTVHFKLSNRFDASLANCWEVKIIRSVFLGDMNQIHVLWGAQELVIRQVGSFLAGEGGKAYLSLDPQHCALLEG